MRAAGFIVLDTLSSNAFSHLDTVQDSGGQHAQEEVRRHSFYQPGPGSCHPSVRTCRGASEAIEDKVVLRPIYGRGHRRTEAAVSGGGRRHAEGARRWSPDIRTDSSRSPSSAYRRTNRKTAARRVARKGRPLRALAPGRRARPLNDCRGAWPMVVPSRQSAGLSTKDGAVFAFTTTAVSQPRRFPHETLSGFP
jgi:hypothetical protein